MRGFFTGIAIGAVVGAACGAFMTPGANKNVKAMRYHMAKMGK